MGELGITVAVCTRNNAQRLRRLLSSFAALRVPEDCDWELLLVDNGSSDDTATAAGDWHTILPLRLVHEPRLGLSNARNAAASQARGSLICWTDDDVIVPPLWLSTYWKAFLRHPNAAIFGGKIEPVAETPVAPWFENCMYRWPLSSVTACRDLGSFERPLLPRADAVPWGANYAIRADVQRRLRYDVALDFGEETDLIGRALAGGETGWWLPESVVTHFIAPERQTRSYVARYFRRAGWAAGYLLERHKRCSVGLTGADGWTGKSDWFVLTGQFSSDVLEKGLHAVGLEIQSVRHLARANYLRGLMTFRRRRDAVVRPA